MIDINEYLNNFYKGTKEPSLKAMQYFIKKYNNFEKEMKFIHIAGTNGKGSCTEIISNILEKQGYKVGKFLSPHLIRYNERISINGKEILDEDMLKLIEELKPLIDLYNKTEETKVTLFELETTMALLYFYRNKVDFVVLETGLGGLYDCTNIITKPLVSLITSIGYDHMHILGDTLPKIAFQKAGIIKTNSNTVIFEQENEVNEVFVQECKKKNNKLHIVTDSDIANYSFDEDYQYFDYKDYKNLSINLKGKVQIKNASLCIEAMNILNEQGYLVDIRSIQDGLKTIIHKGRMEKLNDKPLIIYDGAHNEPAIRNLKEMVNQYYMNKKRIYIISVLQRKDYKKMLSLLSEDKDAIFILTSGNDEDRYASSDELYKCMQKYVNDNRLFKNNLNDAITNIFEKDNLSNNIYLIVGSFYTYGTVIETIKKFNSNLSKGVKGCQRGRGYLTTSF